MCKYNMEKIINKGVYLIAISFILINLNGCAPVPKLLQYDDVRDVYSSKESFNVPSDFSKVASKSVSYMVPYADLFRIVSMSASQVMFDVESADEDKGIILATREKDEIRSMYFHAILLAEIGPKETKVTVLSKLQSACSEYTEGQRAMYAIGSLGITEAVIAGVKPENDCEYHVNVHWPNPKNIRVSPKKEVNQLFTIIRNNLMSQGLM